MAATHLHRSAHAPSARSSARRGWFLSAVALVVVGLVGAAVWTTYGVLRAWRAPEGFARDTVPGTVSVRVTEPGTQWLYHEHPGGTPAASLPDLRVRISAPTGDPVTPEPTPLDVEYDARDGRRGTAIGTFAATTPGTYTVTTAGRPGPGTTLAVGPDVADPLWTPLLGAAAVVVLSLMTAAGLVLAGSGQGAQRPTPT